MGGVISNRCARRPALARAALAVLLVPALLAGWGCGRHPPGPTAAAPPQPIAVQDLELAPELAGGPQSGPAEPVVVAQLDETPPAAATADPPAPANPEPVSAPAAERPRSKGMPDPLQPINRRLFDADRAVNDFVTEKTPMMRMIGKAPSPARTGVVNAVLNLDEPRAAANRMLQRKPARALKAAARFVINSTVGIGGLIDVANKLGLKRSRTNFGQTLASYGVKPGAYVYLPVVGPSNVRDVVGTAVDSYFWPVHWLSIGELPRQAASMARIAITRTPRPDDPRERGAGQPYRERYLTVRQAYVEQQLPAPVAKPIEAVRPKYPLEAASPPPSTGAAVVASASR